jgi:hypothetical protein
LLAGVLQIPSSLLLLLLAVVVAVVLVQGPAKNRLSHKTSDVRQTHCLLPSCSASSQNRNKADDERTTSHSTLCFADEQFIMPHNTRTHYKAK